MPVLICSRTKRPSYFQLPILQLSVSDSFPHTPSPVSHVRYLGSSFGKEDEQKKKESVQILNGGKFSKLFEKILTAGFRPLTSHHKRERLAVILAMLSMELGVKIEDRFISALYVLRPWLPNMEQQLQLFTALNEYKNDGTPWVSGSKNLEDAVETSGDELWYSGLGLVKSSPY